MAIKSRYITALLLSGSLILSACSDKNTSVEENQPAEQEKVKDQYEQLMDTKNAELELEALELTSYAEEVNATLRSPEYKEFSANGQIDIAGTVEKHADLKGEYVWIKVRSDEDGPTGDLMEYYAPIRDGEFKEKISFFNGEGEYKVTVQLPDTERENYYYDIASFTVHNVNPESTYDITLTPFGHDAGLQFNVESAFLKENELFALGGKAAALSDGDTIMLQLKKDSDIWKHMVTIENGQFSTNIPLFYGKGVHQLEVLVPDGEREDYYQLASTLYIDNASERVMQPLEYYTAYKERGVTLESPQYGGDEAEGTYSVKGKIDPKAEFGQETTHIYVSTKKGADEALDVIPVENYEFDGSFYLRFGPGEYEVTLSVPEIKEENSDFFRYYGFAKFQVTASAEDKRDLLPSRGVQSDAPEIIKLAEELTADKDSNRAKAKAVYEYVAKNVSYDVQKYKNNEFEWDDSALKTLDSMTGVCQDYAYLAIALLRASGIEARYVEGRAGSPWPGNHAWVEANLDGEWVEMDPTWGSGYLDRDDNFVAAFNEDYFDPNPDEFQKTHTRTGVRY
ncbi:transglutaminase domain-containing protein [Bacillus sp. RO1]|uniref:transglutaminase-like domain-containing protein n=1 Tax=Bacillus sp. RO1 TaxID=2722703 RepID=UPI0014568FB7|nr:transglutaminase domain-containing protein [Bacillus sp. RO1]NLP49832.1 transglutaminase domain-containing protein [Bacillus sp. RO1]